MDILTPEALQSIVNLLQMGMDPQNQDFFFENLNILESNPQFLFALIRIISNQDVTIPIRIVATSLLRHDFINVPNDLVDDFCKEADQNLFYSLQIPMSNLVSEIAVLTSEIYKMLKKRTDKLIFPFLEDKLTQTIQNANYCQNAIIFAAEFSSVGYSVGSTFASFLPNFVIGPLSEFSLLIISSLLPLHSDITKEAILPILFQNLDKLSVKSLSLMCEIVGKLLRDDRNQIFIDFIVQCMENENDCVVFSAFESIISNEMIPYQESIVVGLFKRLGNDFNLCESNVSTFCLKVLKRTYEVFFNSGKIHPFLLYLISQSLESNETNEIHMRGAIRCYSILTFEETEVEKVFNFLSNFLNTPFCCDASYSIAKITKRHPHFYAQTFNVVFQVLSSESFNVRFQILNYLTNLSNKVYSKLSEEMKCQIPSEPFLSVLLQMIHNHVNDDDEFIQLLRLVASFCSIIQSFEISSFDALFQITMAIMSKRSDVCVECLHIFGSIVHKQKEAFPQVFQLVAPIASSLLINQRDSFDISIFEYSLNFFSNAIEGASKFELITDEFNNQIIPICNFTFYFTDSNSPHSSFSTQKAGWSLFYNIVLYDKILFDFLKNPIICLLINNKQSNCDLKVVGIKCQLINVLIDMYEALLDDGLKPYLINVCLFGLDEEVGDADTDRQICMLCLLKLALITPGFNLDNGITEDASNMLEFIHDQNILGEMENCLRILTQPNEQ